uniref:Uncharacterized protein n=1 Tax=Solanum tuberosum TaxID=4113 RepID=M1DIY6_SOLTU
MNSRCGTAGILKFLKDKVRVVRNCTISNEIEERKKENQKLEGYYRWENKPRSFACPWSRAKHARAVRFEREKSKLKRRQGNRVRVILGLPGLASLVRKKM